MRHDIIADIWEYHGVDGLGFYGYLERFGSYNQFREMHYFSPELAKPGVDLYFSPGLFAGSRANDKLCSFKVLWADLDEGYDSKRLKKLEPTIMWQTSPFNYQAVWFLDKEPHNYEEWATLNKGLTYWLGADKGGWAGSKLLRVPESVNWKRWDAENGTAPRGSVLIDGSVTYKPRDFYYYFLEDPNPKTSANDEAPPAMPKVWMDKYWDENYPTLPMSVQAALTKAHVTDRSAYIWDVCTLMHKMGVHKVRGYYLLMGRPWNKYRDRPQVLWSTINKAYDH